VKDYITLHRLKVWRDGTAKDYCDAEKFQIIQQEKELDRKIYNGKRTALCFLTDMRVGDVVEVALTKRGENPIFGNHYANEIDVSWDSPVKAQSTRIIPRADQQLFWRWQGQKPVTVKEKHRNGGELWWLAGPMPADTWEDNVPSWFVQHPYLEISDFKSWADVVEWALPLYELPAGNDRLLQEKAEELRRLPGTLEDKAVAAVIISRPYRAQLPTLPSHGIIGVGWGWVVGVSCC
jgi:hypothetical protein